MYPLQFAKLYDELTDDYDYDSWAGHYIDLARLMGRENITGICECGCGTGSMSVRWADAGINVTGVDISCAMLDIASRKARDMGLDVRFVMQDMTCLTLTKPVDCVFCPCDGVNYLLNDLDALAFFQSAFKWLKPKGVLAFDISTPHKLSDMAEKVFFEDREDVTYYWRNAFKDGLAYMELTFFVRRPGGTYERFDERQTQRAYEKDDIIGLLTRAGFEGARAFGAMGFGEPSNDDDRWHFAAVRP